MHDLDVPVVQEAIAAWISVGFRAEYAQSIGRYADIA